MNQNQLTSYLLSRNVTITPLEAVTCLLCALVLAMFMYYIYRKTYTGVAYSRNFNVSLVLLAIITTIAMLAIGNNLTLSLGMVGSLSIIRFRTAIKEPKDIAFVFWAISIGLCCGASMYIISTLGSVMLAVVLVVFARHPYDSAAYLLVVRGQAGALPTADIRAALDACSSRIRLRMSNSTAHEDEMTWELYLTGKGDSTVENLHDRLAALSGISSINIVSYAGETLG